MLIFRKMADREVDDPGGGPSSSSSRPEISDDWKYVTSNSRIVVLPDPRLSSLISEDDDQSSSGTSDHVHGEGLDELEYEYEPGIALQQLEFASPRTSFISCSNGATFTSPRVSVTSSQTDADQACPIGFPSRCPCCGVDYESGK